MPEADKKVSFKNVKATLGADIDVELGQEIRFTGVGYVKHAGVDWIEGEEGKRPMITVQVNDVKITKPKG